MDNGLPLYSRLLNYQFFITNNMKIKLIKDFDVKTFITKKLTYFVLIYTYPSKACPG